MNRQKNPKRRTDRKTKSTEKRPVIAGTFRQWQALFCVTEERTAIAGGDVCKGFGKLPTSRLRCDHLQALLATVIKSTSLTVLSVKV